MSNKEDEIIIEESKTPSKIRPPTPPLNPSTSPPPSQNNNNSGQSPPEDDFDPHQRFRPITRIDSNLSRFLKEFYDYYEKKGFTCILVKELSNIFIALSVVFFSFVLLNHTNIYGMYACKGEECATIEIIINRRLFLDYSWWNYIVLLFCLMVMVYVGFLVYTGSQYVKRMYQIKKFVNMQLGVTEERLQTITWGEIVEKLLNYNRDYEIFRSSKDIDALTIVNSIMRVDNFIIALEHLNVLDLKLPLLKENILPEVLIHNLRWIFDEIFKNRMFMNSNRMFENAKFLKNKFMLYGVLNLVFSPFIVVFIVVKVFFKYFAEFQRDKTFFVKRTWSTLSLWKFRSYNELDHEFKTRISKSHFYADLYVTQFPSPLLSIVGKNVMFYTSSITAIILLLTTFKNPLLIHVTFLGQNLLWWSVILFTVFTAASGLVIGKYKVLKPQKYMNKVGKYTHFLPEHWKKNGPNLEVLKDFQNNYYQMMMKWFAIEMLSIFITPFLLIYVLPKSARAICEFIRLGMDKGDENSKSTVNSDLICGFATFNFKKYNNFGISVSITGGDGIRRKNDFLPKGDGKMIKSYLFFKSNHPTWKEKTDYGASLLCQSLLNLRSKKERKKDKFLFGFLKDEEDGEESLFERPKYIQRKVLKRIKKKKKVERMDDRMNASMTAINLLNTYIMEPEQNLSSSIEDLRKREQIIRVDTTKDDKKDGDDGDDDENILEEEIELEEKSEGTLIIGKKKNEDDIKEENLLEFSDSPIDDSDKKDGESVIPFKGM